MTGKILCSSHDPKELLFIFNATALIVVNGIA
jgi:hypothetical protein